MELYTLNTQTLEPIVDKALAVLPEERRRQMETIGALSDRLDCLGTGLLLWWLMRKHVGAVLLREEGGRPYLAGGPHFSLSHCRGLAAMAVGPWPVGVDAEWLSRSVSPKVSRRFSSEEQRWLAAQEGQDLTAALLTLWTRKESVGKALGIGVLPLLEADVREEADKPLCPTAHGGQIRLSTMRWKGCVLSQAAVLPMQVQDVCAFPAAPRDVTSNICGYFV